jgi:phosphoglycerate dehydrogenase-like enzyme
LDVIYDALDSGRLSAVGMDVYPNEPPDVSHPIFSHPDVLCTPHAMGLSIRATTETYAMVTKGMADVLEGRIPTNVVNSEVFARSK